MGDERPEPGERSLEGHSLEGHATKAGSASAVSKGTASRGTPTKAGSASAASKGTASKGTRANPRPASTSTRRTSEERVARHHQRSAAASAASSPARAGSATAARRVGRGDGDRPAAVVGPASLDRGARPAAAGRAAPPGPARVRRASTAPIRRISRPWRRSRRLPASRSSSRAWPAGASRSPGRSPRWRGVRDEVLPLRLAARRVPRPLRASSISRATLAPIVQAVLGLDDRPQAHPQIRARSANGAARAAARSLHAARGRPAVQLPARARRAGPAHRDHRARRRLPAGGAATYFADLGLEHAEDHGGLGRRRAEPAGRARARRQRGDARHRGDRRDRPRAPSCSSTSPRSPIAASSTP